MKALERQLSSRARPRGDNASTPRCAALQAALVSRRRRTCAALAWDQGLSGPSSRSSPSTTSRPAVGLRCVPRCVRGRQAGAALGRRVQGAEHYSSSSSSSLPAVYSHSRTRTRAWRPQPAPPPAPGPPPLPRCGAGPAGRPVAAPSAAPDGRELAHQLWSAGRGGRASSSCRSNGSRQQAAAAGGRHPPPHQRRGAMLLALHGPQAAQLLLVSVPGVLHDPSRAELGQRVGHS